MNENKKKRDGRKILAGLLAGLGLLGLSVAAASQLNLGWDGNFQAGAVKVDADCQTSAITVAFDDPEFAADTDIPWDIENVNFDAIDAACNGLNYEVAYKVDGAANWVELTSGTAATGKLTVAMPAVDPQTVTDFALTIYGG